MIFSILTLFPQMYQGPFDFSIIKRAKEKKQITINLIHIRDFANDTYGTVDDRPYGGGVGMLLKVDVVDRALNHTKNLYPDITPYSILMDPKGKTLTQLKARDLVNKKHVIVIAGHYEGVDARIETLVDESISIGNYVLTGGELPSMVLIDTVVRLLPGVLTKPHASVNESFTDDALEPPQYTRPELYKNMKVPPVLLSGNHAEIRKWQQSKAKKIPKKF